MQRRIAGKACFITFSFYRKGYLDLTTRSGCYFGISVHQTGIYNDAMPVLALLLLLLCANDVVAQQPDPLREYLTDIADRQLAERREVIRGLHTPEDVRRRQAEAREKILRMMGGLPEESVPLNMRRTGVLERGDYRVEKIVYESLPDFFVTANLYIPTTGSGPYPAVLQPLGHSQTAKARGLYQSLSIGLAKYGFVVLSYDPVGQGERTIFYDEHLESSLVGSSTQEHQMVGVQSLLAGESFARYRVWDGMRGIDLLQSLPEVDGTRIGVAGCSGGGTLTAYIAALDDRVTVAAPACYMSAWEEQLGGTGPQDAEQQFPDQLKDGIGHADFAIAFAPKPYLICNTTDDFFPVEGGERTFEEAQRIYGILGAEDKIGRFVGPGPHGMRPDTRGAIYAWMKRWLKGETGDAPEPDFPIEYDEDLYVTETGQVATSLGGETASTWNIKRCAEIQAARPRADLRGAVMKLTRYKPFTGALNARTESKEQGDGYRIETLRYDAEPGRQTPATLCVPDAGRANKKTVLYTGERASDAAALCSGGYTVLAIDLAGTGETASDWGSYSEGWFGSDKVSWLALMVGRPLVGLRMADIVRGLDLLAQRNLLADGKASGVAKGTAGVSLLHAAAVDARLSRLVLENPLVSYRAIAETPIHRQIFDVVLPRSAP